MIEHKKIKRPKHQPASIDGIIVGGQGQGLGSPPVSSYRPSRGETTPSLGIFGRRSDGFHASRQAPNSLGQSAAESAETAALLDEPIVLDDESARKKKQYYFGHKHPRLRKVLKRGVLALLALIIASGAYFGWKFYITERHIFKGGGRAPGLAQNVDINQLKGEGDGRVNILLLGIGGPGHDGPDLTDTILLVSIDPVNHKADMISIPRDLWVKIPGNGYQKINAAYPDGKMESKAKTLTGQEQDGLKLLDKTLAPVIGVTIHYHAIIDFAAFQQAVDAVGGITFNVPEELYDPTIAWENNYNSVIAKPGVQSMNGSKALLYVKSRETSSDFARGERQRQVLVALKTKILSLGTFSNPVKVSNLLSSLGNNIYTDFSLSDIKRLYTVIGQIPSASIVSLDLVTPPHNLITTGNLDGLSIDEPRLGLYDYTDINAYIRTTLRDGFIAKENANVAVYNATNVAGAATAEAKVLKIYGYNVTTIDDAPTTTNPARTVVVDLTKGVDKYTRHYLEGRFGVTALSKIPAGTGIVAKAGTSFVIIVGEDVANAPQ